MRCSHDCRLGLNRAPRNARRCCRGQKTPPTKSPNFGRGSAHSLWERPWPRRRFCRPPASVKAAIASKRALPRFARGTERGCSAGCSHDCRLGLNQAPRTTHGRCRGRRTPPTKKPNDDRGSLAFPVGAALAAMRLWLAAGLDQGRNLLSKPAHTDAQPRRASHGVDAVRKLLRRSISKPSETTVRRGFPDSPIALRSLHTMPSEFHPSDARRHVVTRQAKKIIHI